MPWKSCQLSALRQLPGPTPTWEAGVFTAPPPQPFSRQGLQPLPSLLRLRLVGITQMADQLAPDEKWNSSPLDPQIPKYLKVSIIPVSYRRCTRHFSERQQHLRSSIIPSSFLPPVRWFLLLRGIPRLPCHPVFPPLCCVCTVFSKSSKHYGLCSQLSLVGFHDKPYPIKACLLKIKTILSFKVLRTRTIYAHPTYCLCKHDYFRTFLPRKMKF